MKPRWQIRRRTAQVADGQRRWDLAYQRLLEWSRCPAEALPPGQETEHDANGAWFK